MKLIVGLGNPGKQYQKTRHNVGLMMLSSYARDKGFGVFQKKQKFQASLAEKIHSGQKVILVKPDAFMNLNGAAVLALKQFYRIKNNNILVIHDELDIPFGVIRVRLGGSSAGHNGVESVINSIGEDFYRIRIGIHPNKPHDRDAHDFVLSTFTETEFDAMPDISQAVYPYIEKFITNSISEDTKRL